MKGAEKAHLFETGQYGRLYIVSSQHARGETLRIQVLPKDEKAVPNGNSNLCLNKNAVEVYGILRGQPGWTEEYGWLYEGKWQDDFNKLVMKQQVNFAIKEEKKHFNKEAKRKEKELQNKKLLSNY